MSRTRISMWRCGTRCGTYLDPLGVRFLTGDEVHSVAVADGVTVTTAAGRQVPPTALVLATDVAGLRRIVRPHRISVTRLA